ncbi:MAG: pyruvate kinase [Gammaproteobacteria bacterium]|nr:pyruvate kinase [Gammaproteobacteria bacterium]
MSNSLDPRLIRRLIGEVDQLLQEALDFELLFATDLDQVAPDRLPSARNLLHYLAVRRHDIRKLQESLSAVGLSSLGRMEAHTLATLAAVRTALHHLAGERSPPVIEHEPPVDIASGPQLLVQHANALLGTAPQRRSSRIMVTMPSEAAHDAGLVRDLLQAGMAIMRVNCAHDDPDTWLAMIANLRRCESELGVHCKVLADLAGPKLRTGVIGGGERLVKVRPQRDVRGRVVRNARIGMVAIGSLRDLPDCDAHLPVSPALIAAAKVGDEIRLRDTRGRRRLIAVVAIDNDVCVGECDRTCYIEAGQPIHLVRSGQRVIEGVVGVLPEVAAYLTLKVGERLRVTLGTIPGTPALRDADGNVIENARVPCTLGSIIGRVQRGERVWFDDGRIGGVIVETSPEEFLVEIRHARPGGAKLRADKGINLPDTTFDMAALTAKDYADLDVIAAHVDMVGLSFLRRPDDIELLVERLAEIGAGHLGIVLKIENRRAFERLPRILLVALRSPPVGIMVARGDLAVEMGFERLSEVQEEMLWMCEAAHVPVIWATQVLEELAKTGAPSRAEVTDAAMSSRAECVMLNKGPYIADATRFLAGVLERMALHQSKKSATLRKLSVSQMS